MDVRKRFLANGGGWVDRFGPTWAKQVALLKDRFGSAIESIDMPPDGLVDMPVVRVRLESLPDLLTCLKQEADFDYKMLVDYTATDETPRERRFDLVIMLLSIPSMCRIRIKASVALDQEVPTLIPVWIGANWAEREIFDMFGIRFSGHPDLRRILMDERWVGHPLRKDYPVRGYQIIPTPEEIHPELLE